MRKGSRYLLLLIFFVLISCSIQAQNTKSVQLKPILKLGKHYFYNGKLVYSAYALQIPLQAVQNEEVNLYFKRYRTIRKLKGLVYVPVFYYLFSSPLVTQSQADNLFALLIGAIAADITLKNVAHRQMKHAIDLYNVAILNENAIGLNLEMSSPITPLQIGLTFKFK